MNKFNYDVGRKCLIAEGWCPKNATEKVVGALRVATESSGALVPSIMTVIKSREEPPTYFKTNKFTRVRKLKVESVDFCRLIMDLLPLMVLLTTEKSILLLSL